MSLTLIYIKADELLYTLPVLQLSRAVAGILTWLSKGALCFSHFLIHSSQTQPRVKQRKHKGERFGYSFPDGYLQAVFPYTCTGTSRLHLQGNYVCIGCLDSNTERVLPIAIHCVLICPSLEEQADLTAEGKEKTIRAEIPALLPHTEVGREHCPSIGRHSFTYIGLNQEMLQWHGERNGCTGVQLPPIYHHGGNYP